MPKIRKKQKLFVNGSFIEKSGVLSRTTKNIIKKDNDYKRFYKVNLSSVNLFKKINAFPFNDNNTLNFDIKSRHPVFTVGSDYVENNKIIHSPNTFDASVDNIDKLLTRFSSDLFVLENFDNIDDLDKPFDDNLMHLKDNLSSKKEYINISLPFDNPCRLSFNKNSSNSSTVTFDGTSYNTHNGNIVYYNFKNNMWDYLGDITQNYFQDIDSFLNAPIAFNTIKTDKSNIIDNQVTGMPIETFGFPYEKRFQAMNRHYLNMANYIDSPFVLTEVKIKVKNSVKAANITDEAFAILNSLNFFIINQRKNLNGASYNNLQFQNKTTKIFDGNLIVDKNYTHEIGGANYGGLNVFSNMSNTGTLKESITTYTGSASGETIQYDENQSSQRDLVAFLNITSFNSGSTGAVHFDYDKVKTSSDLFYEVSSQTSNPNLSTEVSYDNVTHTVSGSVASPVFHNYLENISNFNIYPNSKYDKRTGTGYSCERSLNSDLYTDNNTKKSLDSYSFNLEINDKHKVENPYMIRPEDNLVFGFSFNPCMQTSSVNGSLLGKDLSILHDIVEVSLIGSYYKNEKFFSNKDQNYHFNSNKNIFDYNDKILDKFGSNNIYLNKGAYYDKNVNVADVVYVTNVFSGAKLSDLSVGDARSFIGYETLLDKNYIHIDSIGASIDNLKYNKHFYSYFKFGQPFDKILYTKNFAERDELTKKKNYVLRRKFRNKYFNAVTPTLTYSQSDPANNLYYQISYPAPFLDVVE